jgi:hypothetical protein
MNDTKQNESIGILRFDNVALGIGAVFLAASIAGAFTATEQFFRSWLLGFVFWAALTLGSLGILMIQYLTGGWWGYIIRKPLLASIGNLPLIILAALPVYFGASHIFPWMNAELMANDHILHSKVAYLNFEAFAIRGIIFAAIWMLLSFMIRKRDAEYDRTGSPAVAVSLRRWSAPGLLVMAITMTFASIDWLMSLDPYWFSTMFGISFMVGAMLLAFACMIVVVTSMADYPPLSEAADPIHFRDLGNLLFAFVMLWAYTAFSQFLLIWYSNMKEEIPWYIVRQRGAWGVVAIVLIVGHFFMPFLLLLMRGIKDRAALLGKVAAFVMIIRSVDYFWIMVPTWHTKGHEAAFSIHWLDFTTILGIGGVWMFFFLRRLRAGALLPVQPDFEGAKEAVTHG